ncbi:MAG: malate synthase G, partial [Gammaproteobacteria bacterium]|nr:malate synthase G [Gammaproteobacteria bacterium]
MSDRVDISGLSVDRALYDLVEEISADTGVKPPSFWQSLAQIVGELGLQNADLLQKRDQLQAQIDDWHKANPGPVQRDPYQAFLQEIGYLAPEPDPFEVTTDNVDDEIAVIAGPQLVVPVDNARYALNAANARWYSLYDALYGTNII